MFDNKKVLEDGLKKAQQVLDRRVEEMLFKTCAGAIDIVRSEHQYDNYTFNLEQSVAYAVYHNGAIVKMDWSDRDWSVADEDKYLPFKNRGYTNWQTEHDDGPDNSKAFLTSYVSTKTWEVVFIAGAEYAAKIQKKYNSDSVGVLWGAFTFIERNLIKNGGKR